MKADDDTVWRCLPVLVAVVLEDVFGDTAAQKEDESGYRPDGGNAGMRELKSCKSFDTFEVVCSAIKFLPDASIHVILSPILQKLAGHPSQKTVNKVQRLLHRAVVGLAHNSTVTVANLLVYVHELVSNYAFLDIRREKKSQDDANHRRHRGTDVWLAGEGGLDEHALTKQGQGDSNQKLRIRKRRGLLAHDKEKTFLVAPEPSFNGGTSMSDQLDDERSNRGSVGNTSGYAFSVTAENDDDEYGDYESDEEAAAARARKQFATNGFVVADFGVSLMLNFLKRKQLSRLNEEHQKMVAPMLDLFANCFEQSRSDDLTAKVAQALNNLMTWPLPHGTTKKVQKRIRNRVFDVLSERGVDTAAPVVQACFGVLATLLEKRSVDLNKLQNEILVDLIRGSIDSASKLQKSSFKLTKAIIARKVLAPCVYDLIEHFCELLVVAQDENVRKDCRAVVMRYLLTYPLSEKRLHSHLVFFVKNLEFDYESGRRSLLSLMYSIANRFPVDVLDTHCEFLFLPLVVRLVNDDSATCRADVGNVLRRLIEAVSAGKKVALTDLCIGWLDAARKNTTLASAQLGRAGAQVLGFAVEKLDANLSASSRSVGKFKQVVVRATQALAATIREAAEWVVGGGEEDEAERVELEGVGGSSGAIRTGTDRDYKVYYSLIASEKLLDHWLPTFLETVGVKRQFIGHHAETARAQRGSPAAAAGASKKSASSAPIGASDLGIDFLSAIRTLLLYKHAWVRLSSCRIVGKFFASVTPPPAYLSPVQVQAQVPDGGDAERSGARSAHGEDNVIAEWKKFQQALFDVTAALCSQFESSSLGAELATQIVKNLVFLGKHFLNLAAGEAFAPAAAGDKVLAKDKEGEEEGRHDPLLDEDEEETTPADRGFSSGARALKWLFHRVSYMARTRGEAQQQAIFKWFAAMATSSVSVANGATSSAGTPGNNNNAADILREYLMHMLSPLVRAAAFVKDGRESTPKYAVGELAQEVMAHLESTLGSEAYLPVHMRVIAQIRQSRLERKQKRKLAAVLDPEAHAARKRERNKRKRRQKRTKVDGFRSKDGRDLKRRDQ